MRLKLKNLQRVVRQVVNERKLTEAGVAQPKVDKEPLDIYGTERMGDASKTFEGPELSEQWYADKAHKFMQDYGGVIEDSWEEVVAHRFVSSVKATSGVEIDEARLLKAIKEAITDRDERALKRDQLKETLAWLNSREDTLVESSMPEFVAPEDPVRDLVENTELSSQEYIEHANEVFKIREATLPQAIRKHRLGEDNRRNETVPVNGHLPHDGSFRSIDELALCRYVECWNSRQAMKGEPLQIEWNVHPDSVNKISFNCILK